MLVKLASLAEDCPRGISFRSPKGKIIVIDGLKDYIVSGQRGVY